MAQKTKAQKIASDERRREQLISQIHYTPTWLNGPPPLTIEDTYAKAKPVSKEVAYQMKNSADYGYVVADLKKIGIFATLAFGAEIVLWYFLR